MKQDTAKKNIKKQVKPLGCTAANYCVDPAWLCPPQAAHSPWELPVEGTQASSIKSISASCNSKQGQTPKLRMLNAQGQPARELVKFRSTHSTKGVRRDKRNTGRSTAKQYSDSPNPMPVYPSWLQTTPKYQNWWESPESTMPVQIWRLPNSKEHRHVGKWQLLCQSLEPTESELQHVAPTSSIWGNENGQELVRREMSSNVKHSQIIFDSVQEKLKSFHPPRSGLVGNEQTEKIDHSQVLSVEIRSRVAKRRHC